MLRFSSKHRTIIVPTYVLPVPGGPWMTQNSVVIAVLRASSCELLRGRALTGGHFVGCKTGTAVAL